MTRTVLRSLLPFVFFTRVRLRRVHARAVVDETGPLESVGVGSFCLVFLRSCENELGDQSQKDRCHSRRGDTGTTSKEACRNTPDLGLAPFPASPNVGSSCLLPVRLELMPGARIVMDVGRILSCTKSFTSYQRGEKKGV
jgi:hypothetical protein